MSRYLVCISDRRTDILVGAHDSTADVWCYEIEADQADSAVAPAVEQWRADVGERVAVSLTVSQMPAAATSRQ